SPRVSSARGSIRRTGWSRAAATATPCSRNSATGTFRNASRTARIRLNGRPRASIRRSYHHPKYSELEAMARRSTGPALATLRERLAQTAARLMIEGGIEDYGLAKRKAAERLGVKDLGALPSNAQIAASVAERQRIFEPQTHRMRVTALRRTALSIMDLLAPFQPRLVEIGRAHG